MTGPSEPDAIPSELDTIPVEPGDASPRIPPLRRVGAADSSPTAFAKQRLDARHIARDIDRNAAESLDDAAVDAMAVLEGAQLFETLGALGGRRGQPRQLQ